MDKDTINTKEAAALVNREPSTLDRWRRLRKGPPFFYICGRISYSKRDIENWVAEQKQLTQRVAL